MTGVAGYGDASVGGGSMAVVTVTAHEMLRAAKVWAIFPAFPKMQVVPTVVWETKHNMPTVQNPLSVLMVSCRTNRRCARRTFELIL